MKAIGEACLEALSDAKCNKSGVERPSSGARRGKGNRVDAPKLGNARPPGGGDWEGPHWGRKVQGGSERV